RHPACVGRVGGQRLARLEPALAPARLRGPGALGVRARVGLRACLDRGHRRHLRGRQQAPAAAQGGAGRRPLGRSTFHQPWVRRRGRGRAAGVLQSAACGVVGIKRATPWLCAGAAFVLYAVTVTRGVAWDDAGELGAGVARLGSVHAIGYPVYVLLGHAFVQIEPFGSWALRANLWSAAGAAATAGVVALYVV